MQKLIRLSKRDSTLKKIFLANSGDIYYFPVKHCLVPQ